MIHRTDDLIYRFRHRYVWKEVINSTTTRPSFPLVDGVLITSLGQTLFARKSEIQMDNIPQPKTSAPLYRGNSAFMIFHWIYKWKKKLADWLVVY